MPRVRLPFVGSYNTRPGTGTLTGASAIADIAVAGLAICGTSAAGSSKDQKFLNCFQITVTDPVGSKKLYLVNRAGFAALNTPRSGHIGNAIKVWGGQSTGTKVMSAFGNTNFKLYDGTTDKGDGTGKATAITETSISGTATLFITSDDNKGWTYQDGGALTQIVDVDFPGNASRTIAGYFAHLDGYAFIMDTTGRVYNGDLNSLTAWTAASYVTANSTPDVGVGVVRHGNTLIAFCRRHFDVFRNAGNAAGSPLDRIQERTKLIGCVSADAIIMVRDTIYFVGTTTAPNIALYAYSDGALSKVSTPEQESVFAIAGASNITLSRAGEYGRHLIICCVASSTLVYCVEENAWHGWTGNQLWAKTDGVSVGTNTITYAISNDLTRGKVYVLNPGAAVYQDDGVGYSAIAATALWDGGTSKRKFASRLFVIGDRATASLPIYFVYTDDDYQTNSFALYGSYLTFNLADERPSWPRLGSFYRRAFYLYFTANAALRLEALELEYTEGA